MPPPMERRPLPLILLGLGLLAFSLAGLSIVDMYLPRAYDGVVLETDVPGRLRVRAVVPGSGADRAGIAPGDEIVGVDRTVVGSTAKVAALLNHHRVGDDVPYFVRSPGSMPREVHVELGPRQIGDRAYLVACLLGFSFFFIGLFVLRQQPDLRASRVFFVLCVLFLLFLVCRLRPASYSWVDAFVLRTGTAALVLLPASFLSFFLIFPRPLWDGRWAGPIARLADAATRRRLLVVLYAVPIAVFAAARWGFRGHATPPTLISGAPAANWWVLAGAFVAGLAALAMNARRLPSARERRGAALVLVGAVVGLLPFLVLGVAFPAFLRTERFLFWGVAPLAAIPLTFAYAIVRFQLLDVRVILRKSLLYTGTTAVVTAFYALGIAAFNKLSSGTELATSPYFPLVFALAIVLLFEPLRRRLQGPVDRFFFAERARLQRAMMELGEAFTGGVDPAAVVRDLVGKLPALLGLSFAALYLHRERRFVRAAGPEALPAELTVPAALFRHLRRGASLARLDDLGLARLRSAEADELLRSLAGMGVEVIAALSSTRRRIGLVLLSAKDGQTTLEREELDLLRGLLQQAAIALETSVLLEERARQAELERELEIAAAIQRSLLPPALALGPGWRAAAACRTARHVGGDFYAALPGPEPGTGAILYGDVSGKSVPGALLMMAAKEVFHSLALSDPDPEELFRLANLRLYDLQRRSFVALGYFALRPDGRGLRYLVAGQPQPLVRRGDGRVEALPLPDHRLPLGALRDGGYAPLEVALAPGEVLLATSDGVVEARSPAGEFFGDERLAAALAAAAPDPDAAVAAVLAAVDEFCRGHEPYDDLTVVALGRVPPP
jgi:serine phosphatase RsbU (regulator of sigma subunit)